MARPLLAALLALLPVAALAQPASVTFRVHMAYHVEQGLFDPATESVDVAGTFNGWGSTLTPLADPDGDLTYEVTRGGFQAGQAIAYKYRINGRWDGREEFPGVGNNREYDVLPGENVVTVWYNDVPPPTGPPQAAFSGTQVVSAGGVAFFRDGSAGHVTGLAWTFEGGLPATSTDANPAVRYAEPGVYGVTLVASGPDRPSDTLRVADFVEVRPRQEGALRWWNDAVFYEAFVRSFYDSDGDGIGDFQGMTDKLDYLNDGDPETTDDLGVTGLWLMPIHDSPSYHGYDVTDYRSVHPDYGSMDDFRALVGAAHERGIRVVIDYVMNHSSREHPWFQASAANSPAYRDFYRWSATDPGTGGPLGDAWHPGGARGYYYGVFWSGMPDLNYASQAVQDSLFAAADFWLDDVGVDGFRLDAVKYLFEDGAIAEDAPQTLAIWSDFAQHLQATAPEALTVCEAWSTRDRILPYVTEGDLDLCFEFGLAGAILGAVQTGDARGLAAEAQEAYQAYPHLQLATFLTNHDQNRVMEELGLDVDRGAAAAALYLTLPGVPFVYYGEEIGMLGRKPDEHIRRPMQWSAAPGAGFTSGTPWIAPNANYASWNVAAQSADDGSLLNRYRRLIHARNGSPALRRGDYHAAPASADGVMAFLRTVEGETVLVAVNTSDEPVADVSLNLPPGVAAGGSYAAESLIGGEAVSLTVTSAGLEGLALEGFGVAVLRLRTAVAAEPESGETSAFGLDAPYPNPAREAVRLGYRVGAGEVQVDVFDLLGRRVAAVARDPLGAGPHAAEIDVSALAPGVYLVRLRQGARRRRAGSWWRADHTSSNGTGREGRSSPVPAPALMPHVVCLSDTHGLHGSLTGRLAVPDGDVLVFAGDACGEGTPGEWATFCQWLGRLPHPHKVVVPGNHDWPLQPDRPRWNVRARYDAAVQALAHRQAEDAGAVLLLDAEATVGGLRVYGSPWVPAFFNWAFNLPRRGVALAEARARIPAGLDVLVTHGPAYRRLDRTLRGTHAGCEVLANRLAALAADGKAPRLHVHGDIHEAAGIRRPRLGLPGRITVNAAVLDAHYNPTHAPRTVAL